MPHTWHDILTRQLKRCLGGPEAVPREWGPFLQAVNDAYRELKKFEVAEENRQREQAERRNRRAQAEADDITLTRFASAQAAGRTVG